MSPHPGKHQWINSDARSETIESCDTIEDLIADLEALMGAGLVVEIREFGEEVRYGPSASARELTSSFAAASHSYPVPDSPEPCPACGAWEGFDGGGRCERCHIAWPPEM